MIKTNQIFLCILFLAAFTVNAYSQSLSGNGYPVSKVDSGAVLKLTFEELSKDSMPIDESINNIDVQVDGRVRYANGPDGEDDRALLFSPEDSTKLWARSPELNIESPAAVSLKFAIMDSIPYSGQDSTAILNTGHSIWEAYGFYVEPLSETNFNFYSSFYMACGTNITWCDGKLYLDSTLTTRNWYRVIFTIEYYPELVLFNPKDSTKINAVKLYYEEKRAHYEDVYDTTMVVNPARNMHMMIDDIKIYNHIPEQYRSLTGIPEERNDIPEKIYLKQNYPNPFNPSTKIQFNLPQAEQVTINVYNTIGQKIETLVNRPMTAGSHSVTFNGEGLPSGVYIYRLKAGDHRESRKMLLVK